MSVGAGGIIVVVARTDQRRVRGRGREGNDDMGGGAMDLMMAPHVLRAESCELVVTVDYVILPGVTLRTNDSATCRSLCRGTGRRGTTPGADCCMVRSTRLRSFVCFVVQSVVYAFIEVLCSYITSSARYQLPGGVRKKTAVFQWSVVCSVPGICFCVLVRAGL